MFLEMACEWQICKDIKSADKRVCLTIFTGGFTTEQIRQALLFNSYRPHWNMKNSGLFSVLTLQAL